MFSDVRVFGRCRVTGLPVDAVVRGDDCEMDGDEQTHRRDSLISPLDPFGTPSQQHPDASTQDISLPTTSFQPTLDLVLQDLPGRLVLLALLTLGEQGGRQL